MDFICSLQSADYFNAACVSVIAYSFVGIITRISKYHTYREQVRNESLIFESLADNVSKMTRDLIDDYSESGDEDEPLSESSETIIVHADDEEVIEEVELAPGQETQNQVDDNDNNVEEVEVNKISDYNDNDDEVEEPIEEPKKIKIAVTKKPEQITLYYAENGSKFHKSYECLETHLKGKKDSIREQLVDVNNVLMKNQIIFCKTCGLLN